MTATRPARDRDGVHLNELPWGAVQTVAHTSGASALSGTFDANTTVLRLVSDQACWVRLGTAPTASNTATYLPANVVEKVAIDPANLGSIKVAVISVSTSGTLNITEMAI